MQIIRKLFVQYVFDVKFNKPSVINKKLIIKITFQRCRILQKHDPYQSLSLSL